MYLFDFITKFPVAVFRKFTQKSKECKMFGTYIYTSLAGAGKTYSIVKDTIAAKRKFGDDIFIVSNIDIKIDGESIVDRPLKKISDITERVDKQKLIVIDELPFLFSSRKFKDFPYSMLCLLTTCRKNKGVAIFCSTQRLYLVDKTFRTLCDKIIVCRTYFGNLTCNYYYDPLKIDNDTGELTGQPDRKECFLQSDEVRNAYDSFDSVSSVEFDEN